MFKLPEYANKVIWAFLLGMITGIVLVSLF